MFRPSLPPARAKRSALVASLATLAVTAALTSVPGAPASSAPLDSCPAAYPVADLFQGQEVDGLTVTSGASPSPFGGTVIGVLQDGIAPDVDMIMMRLTSDEIDRVGGIWAGMSGSPVYAQDGTLIGAVAYGLSWGPSPVAGITPAADMQKLLDLDAGARQAPRRVAIPQATADRLVRQGVMTRAEADGGMQQLATPLAVSGMSTAKRLKKATNRLGLSNVKVYRSGAAPAQRAAEPDPLVPGGNLAASLSYGDFSAVGTGTVTMVCGEQVVGFGHPFDWTGRTSLTLHDADALYIQEDSLGAPFKVSNPSGPVGTIDQDRQVGIAGFMGAQPETTDVSSTIESTETGDSRTGHTYVSVQDYLPDLAALGVVANAGKVLDAVTDGNAGYSFTISGSTQPASGSPVPFTIQRDNVMASSWDIAYMAPEELYETLWRLQQNKFSAVKIDSIDFDGDLSPDYRKYKISSVEVKQDGQWITATRRTKVFAKPGEVLKVRATLGSFRDELPGKKVTLNVPVTWKNGESGAVFVGGGDSGEFFFKAAARSAGVVARAGTFDDLVDSIENAPHGDEVSATLFNFETGAESDPVVSNRLGDPVGGSKTFRLVVRK